MADSPRSPQAPTDHRSPITDHRSSTAIQIEGVTKTYPSGLAALGTVDLQVREGEFVTLLGPSGCGKSTLLRMVGALLRPSTGTVRVWPDSAQVSSRERLAFVFQSPTLMPWASVERNVRLPLDLTRTDVDSAPKIQSALGLVGLHDFQNVYPRELSGGMQMRVSIARALVTEPRLLLMDEPFGALDEITRYRLDREIRDLWARRSLTVLFVTHSIYEAVFLSTRVLVMSARPGRIVGELDVHEPHPRADAFRLSERFARQCAQLSAMLADASGENGRDAA
jgi:NitT/TauT family transport system ATP-binding protein